MKNLEIKKQIIETCLWLQEKELVIGTWGNVSMRVDNSIVLTPSKISYDVLTPEDMVTIDYDGNVIDGHTSPTTEREVHRLIYIARPDVNAIVHYHPVYASAMCATGEEIPPIFEEMTQLLGGSVPTTPEYIRAGMHEELGQAAAKYLGQKNAVLLRNHAPVCVGKDLEYAKIACLVLEKAASCYIALKNKFDIKVIPNEFVELEHHRFFHAYGKEW
ncbi:L-ribulose-5-phosphate 4-epimerase [Spirochaetia bacterium]|nr:L-ribulose-5-phosphate 4-epimerase [Spirochaetia bacterium]